MSWGDSLVGGFSAMRSTLDKKSQREQDERLATADRELKQQMLEDQIKGDMTKLRMGFDANLVITDKNHRWQTGEREATQGFQSGQNDLNRGLTQQQINDQRRRDNARVALEAKQLDSNIRMDGERLKQWNSMNATKSQPPPSTYESTYDSEGNPTGTVIKGTGAPPPFSKPTTSTATTPAAAPSGPGLFGRLADSMTHRGTDALISASTPFGSAAVTGKNLAKAWWNSYVSPESEGPPQTPTAAAPAPASSTPGQYEGQILTGPDGKQYKVVNGQRQPIN